MFWTHCVPYSNYLLDRKKRRTKKTLTNCCAWNRYESALDTLNRIVQLENLSQYIFCVVMFAFHSRFCRWFSQKSFSELCGFCTHTLYTTDFDIMAFSVKLSCATKNAHTLRITDLRKTLHANRNESNENSFRQLQTKLGCYFLYKLRV